MADALGHLGPDRLHELAFGVGHDGERDHLALEAAAVDLFHDRHEIGQQAEAVHRLRVLAEDALDLGAVRRLLGVVDERVDHLAAVRLHLLLEHLHDRQHEGVLQTHHADRLEAELVERGAADHGAPVGGLQLEAPHVALGVALGDGVGGAGDHQHHLVLDRDRPRRHAFGRAPVADQRLRLVHVDELVRQVGRHRGARLGVLDEQLELAPEHAAAGVDLRRGALRRLAHVGPVGAGVAGERQGHAQRDRRALRVREIQVRRGERRCRRGADRLDDATAVFVHFSSLC